MKKRDIILCFIFFFGMLSSVAFAISFHDLPSSHWAYQNITTLVNKGVINGYPDGTYRPENAVTRAEFIKLVMVSVYDNSNVFDAELGKVHWALPYALLAYHNDYLPSSVIIRQENIDQEISRLEMAQILARICSSNSIGKENIKLPEFSDIYLLDNESIDAINCVAMRGLINGYPDGTFGPYRTMTRAECATIIYRLLNVK